MQKIFVLHRQEVERWEEMRQKVSLPDPFSIHNTFPTTGRKSHPHHASPMSVMIWSVSTTGLEKETHIEKDIEREIDVGEMKKKIEKGEGVLE